jgi:hypothetical protein
MRGYKTSAIPQRLVLWYFYLMETNIENCFFDEPRHWDKFILKHKGKIRPIVLNDLRLFDS